ncbi:response regulator transcription factor [Streptomyces pseudovenezuelae]|uniref:response regulator transcription factor n=1 Tax=Streptomyces pseudovenezuelae TaxID=67350 RepID=UPI0039A45FBF
MSSGCERDRVPRRPPPPRSTRVIGEFAHARASRLPLHSVGQLTAREAQVLTLIARGLSNAEIAGWLAITDHTVKTSLPTGPTPSDATRNGT